MGEEKSNEKRSFCDIGSFSLKEFVELGAATKEERNKRIDERTKSSWTTEEVLKIEPISPAGEIFSIFVFLFGVPGCVFSIPIVLLMVGYLLGSISMTFLAGFLVFFPLILMPAPFQEEVLSSWYCLQILKYFSFKCIYAQKLEENKPYILVAPPHGVFPYGNILTMIAFPSVMGFSFLALASSVALRVPIFRQLLGTIGAIDASRSVASKALANNKTIGISTGGVAEIFETNSKTGDEVVVLQSRKGLVKLAMRTGAALVPCYLFGNTKLLSLFCGGEDGSWGKNFLQSISRKTGAALILFWGRFFLPIPYRTPILGVMGKPIGVIKSDEPTDEQVDHYHSILLKEMIKLFDEHKKSYGWADKRLIIK